MVEPVLHVRIHCPEGEMIEGTSDYTSPVRVIVHRRTEDAGRGVADGETHRIVGILNGTQDERERLAARIRGLAERRGPCTIQGVFTCDAARIERAESDERSFAITVLVPKEPARRTEEEA